MSLQTVDFSQEHIEDAAALVTSRYRALRRQLPILPEYYETPDWLFEPLDELRGENYSVVALEKGRLIGFLTGFSLPRFLGKPSYYSPDWANAAEFPHSRQIYEALYGWISGRWVAQGCSQHAISILASDPRGIEAWQWLGFGLINIDGVRSLEPLQITPVLAEVREARTTNLASLTGMVRALEQHVAAPPVFWLHELDNPVNWLGKPGYTAWLAFQDDEPVGYLGIEPGDQAECEFLKDPMTLRISGAYIQVERRGHGLGTALLQHALAWGQHNGLHRCNVDFETMNPQAAHFWSRWFAPVSYALLRVVDERASKSYGTQDR